MRVKPVFPQPIRPLVTLMSHLAATFRRTRIGKRPLLLLPGVLMLLWTWRALGANLLFLLILLAVAAAAAWLLRHRRDIVASLAVAALTVATPALTVVIMAGHQAADLPTVAPVLTGYILAGPLPTLSAWALRPRVISRPINSLLGSLLLLAGAVPVAVFGDHGFGTSVLIASLAASCGLVWIRHRRALGRSMDHLTQDDNGWTDLGRRVLPDGTEVHQLLIRRGYAVATTLTTAKTISPAALRLAVDRSVTLASAARLPPSRIQPVLLAPAATQDLGYHRVRTKTGTTAAASATVIVATPSTFGQITALAPTTRRRHRRALLTAAAVLPTSQDPR